MNERTRSRRKPQRPTKPYLSEWILTQPSPEKEVLLQVFSGTPERECARKMGMSVEEVHAISQSAADNGPEVAEDEYAMACFSAKTPEEFTRTTGEGEGIYRFLCLRFHKSPAAPSAEAGLTTQTSMTSAATPSGGTPGSKAESGPTPGTSATPGRPATSSARGRSGGSSRSKAKPSTRKRAATAASKTGTTATSPSNQPVEQQPAPRPVDPNDPEVIRRREARKAAREREKARRLRGDW